MISYIKTPSRKVGHKLILEVTPKKCYPVFSKFGSCVFNESVLWKKNFCRSVALVIFTGGTDINPAIYGENRGKFTGQSDTFRDNLEMRIFRRAKSLGIPMVGICRGAQLLCALSGGRLAQHINGHLRNHLIKTHDGRILNVTSAHHQMQIPSKNAKILAFAAPKLSNFYLDGYNEEMQDIPGDVEVVYYPESKSIGIQSHPEWLHPSHPLVDYCEQLVDEFLMKQETSFSMV